MRIGIDASRATVARRTGTESYAKRLIAALLEAGGARGHAFTLYFRDAPPPGLFFLPGGAVMASNRVMPFPRLWTHVRLSAELLRPGRPHVLFVLAHVLPLAHPLPTVVTVHDLGYRHFPEAHPWRQRLYLEWSTRFSARQATRVIADSAATKRDLVNYCGVPEHKITVVYPGYDDSLRRVDPASVRTRYGLPENYFLHVGTLQPRKNLMRLMEAVSLAPSPVCLVLVGRAGWLAAPIAARARELGDRVRWLEYVPDEDLAGLYSGALALVFPSLFEGFGFPVLEAMACGTPVICSNTSSLPEVAGQAALQVDPQDVKALLAAMGRVQAEPALRAELIERGLSRVREFSWRRTAEETLAVLEEAVC